MRFIEAGNLRLNSPFQVQTILDVKIMCFVNSHARMSLSILVENSTSMDSILGKAQGVSVSLWEINNDKPLFQGRIESISLQITNGVSVVSLVVLSNSRKLDIRKQYRSFQDEMLTFRNMLKGIYAEAGGASIHVNKNGVIPAPILQYGETDWEFTLRMAGYFKTVVIPGHNTPTAQVMFACSDRPVYTLPDMECVVGNDCKQYHIDRQYYKNTKYSDYQYIQLKNAGHFELGDRVRLKKKEYLVVSFEQRLEEGVLNTYHVCGSEFGSGISYRENTNIIGLILHGVVIDRQDEKIKVHFDIDATQSKDTAHWFFYKPEVDNVFYTMPIVGTRIAVRFPGHEEKKAVAIHSPRTNGSLCYDTSDYNNRYYTTEYGKRMALLPDQLFFTDGENNLSAVDASGVSATTGKLMQISAVGQLIIQSKKSINISTTEQVRVTKTNTTSGIDMSGNEINIYSENTQFHADGTGEKPYPLFDLTPAVKVSSAFAATVCNSQVSKLSGRKN